MLRQSTEVDNVELKSLWSEVLGGDKQAFATLFLQNYAHLYNYGRKLYDDGTIVEDAIQDVFATIWQTRNRLASVSSVKSYLIISLRRRLLRILRKERIEDPVEEDDIQEIIPDIEFSAQEIMVGSEQNESRHEALAKILNQLPNQKKEVIYLYFYNGMDYEEIAQIMELNIQTVRNYMSMALARAKDIILEHELPEFLLLVAFFIMMLPR
ncbi:MAG TPA: sigma-70 family RNA polymerase sigma factor [Balneolales bacterium]|nr:sigma-70 family RNA polymerase sigma factor [Balneolales bacterium]